MACMGLSANKLASHYTIKRLESQAPRQVPPSKGFRGGVSTLSVTKEKLDNASHFCYTSYMSLNDKTIHDLSDDNCLIGTSVTHGWPMTIQLTKQEMDLALISSAHPRVNDAWDSMCALVLRRTGQRIIGHMNIDTIVVRGNKRNFH